MMADTMGRRMQAEVLLRGGAIYTFDGGDAETPRATAQALAIHGGRIVAVGDDDDLGHTRGPDTRVVELEGRAVIPGFVDAHVHFGSFAIGRQQVDLDAAGSLAEGLTMLHTAAQRLPTGAWVRGRGWDRNRWGRLPTAADLDGAVGARPAALSSHDGHSMWLNTAALAAAGIVRETEPPAGGVIERDASGYPSGVVLENAQDLVWPHLPKPSDDELREAIASALPMAAAAGLTGVRNFEDARSLAAFQALEGAGQLTLRVSHGVARGQLADARELGLRTGSGSDLVRLGPVKLFSDGALGSRTAYLLEPYEGRTDGYVGVPTLQPEELVGYMRMAGEAGLDVAVHAIGDAAVRGVLDAVEATRAQQPTFVERLVSIEHAQLVHPSDVARFASLGVVASMQPIHAIADWQTADAHWGARARHGYAWRAMLNAGVRLAFGTDAPVEHLEPLLSLHAATTRLDPRGEPSGGWYPEQRVSLAAAVRAYTYGSADVERALDRRGSLAVGKDADLVVLAPDPFPAEPAILNETKVELTMVGGRIVYER